MADEIISRADAGAQGLKRYFTGRACKRGHVVERQVSNRRCIKCQQDRAAIWESQNRDWRQKYEAVYLRRKLALERERRAKDPAKFRKRYQDWYGRDLARARRTHLALVHNRRAKEKAGGIHSAADLKDILSSQRGRCVVCNADLSKIKKHVDHVVPLVRGGSNDRSNLRYLCAPCNLSKGSKDPIDFARERGLLL